MPGFGVEAGVRSWRISVAALPNVARPPRGASWRSLPGSKAVRHGVGFGVTGDSILGSVAPIDRM